jgi:hypothetical protein
MMKVVLATLFLLINIICIKAGTKFDAKWTRTCSKGMLANMNYSIWPNASSASHRRSSYSHRYVKFQILQARCIDVAAVAYTYQTHVAYN